MYSKFKKGKRGHKKKFNRRRTPSHYLKVLCTSNNTHACLTDKTHSVISASSGGNAGFKGAKKSTAYTAQVVIEKVLNDVRDRNIRFISIFIKGIGREYDLPKFLKSDSLFAIAAHFALANETASIALAPRFILFSLPSNSNKILSIFSILVSVSF